MLAACLISTMNRLSTATRAKILHLLVEGASLRSISRLTETSINTVTRLLVDAGNACAEYHDQAVRNVRSKRVQVDEIWTNHLQRQPTRRGSDRRQPKALFAGHAAPLKRSKRTASRSRSGRSLARFGRWMRYNRKLCMRV